MNFVDFVTMKANQCGWKVSDVLSDNLVSITFNTDAGKETCFIRPCGKNSDGNTVLEFSSAGLPVPADESIAGALALALLERNGNMISGHWGIEAIGSEKSFTVFATLIANTMDADEFRGAVTAVISERERLFKSLQKTSIDF
jgi:hypothetical protein